MTSTDQLAERVRKAVEASFHVPADSIYVFSHDDYDAAMDSLPALLAALEAAEQQRDELLADAAGQDERDRNAAGQFLAQMDMLRAAEAREKRAEQDAHKYREKHRQSETDWRKEFLKREAAEARAVSFEKALRALTEVAEDFLNFEYDGGVGDAMADIEAKRLERHTVIARAALAASVPQDGEQA